MTDQKFCNACNQTKPINNFGFRSVNGKQYPRTKCKPCWNKHNGSRPERIPGQLRRKARYNSNIVIKRLECDLDIVARSIRHDSRAADKRNAREFDLEFEFIKAEISKPCSYCGDTKTRMSLDRIDNTLGHLPSNVVPACVRCNMTRGNMPYHAWLVVSQGMKLALEQGLFETWTSKRFNHQKPK